MADSAAADSARTAMVMAMEVTAVAVSVSPRELR
jgi:hypothetical protein